MVDLSKVKRYSIRDRKSKVSIKDLAKPKYERMSFPDTISEKDFKTVVEKIKQAKGNGRQIIWGIGAHVIKCGLSPYIIELMKNGFVSCIATNGAAAIHDAELALFGETSEYVEDSIKDGSFGFCKETGVFINEAVNKNPENGYGKAIGQAIIDENARYVEHSIFANAVKLGIPVTVHVAIGTDITHMHPEFNGSATGRASYKDFLTFCDIVSRLEDGVYLNVGSAVILPEVFLKAVSVARNIGFIKKPKAFTTVNMDFKQMYRAEQNVVKRHGNGFSFIENHEITIPLLANALLV